MTAAAPGAAAPAGPDLPLTGWRDLAAAWLGRPVADPAALAQALQAVAEGRADLAARGEGARTGALPELTPNPPALAPGSSQSGARGRAAAGAVAVIRLNALSPVAWRTSVECGGVFFEDPLLALAAAYNCAHQDIPLAVPAGPHYRGLWHRRGEIARALAARPGAGLASELLEVAVSFLPMEGGPHFDAIALEAEELARLRAEGGLALPRGPGGSALYCELFVPWARL